MNSPVICVEGLGKRYRIGARRTATLRDAVAGLFSAQQTDAGTTIWALRNISFDVAEGEVVGLLGRNGAGKSTLLKILSRITRPTEGMAELRGRVGNLLEVGVGFHQDLTGRENVFLNGAILGMPRREIERKFDEIVAFAETERFLDTPVKHYSSGMYMRLAFAVAAHLESEILIVDEVLAVGDASFQQKCLTKMHQLAAQGRTVLFVSHNLLSIQHLCDRALLFEGGGIMADGRVEDVIEQYERLLGGDARLESSHILFQSGSEEPREVEVRRIEVVDRAGKPKSRIESGDEVVFRVHVRSRRRIDRASVEIIIGTTYGADLLQLFSELQKGLDLSLDAGDSMIECRVEHMPLAPGTFNVAAGVAERQRRWLFRNDYIAKLTVVAPDSAAAAASIGRRGLVALPQEWSSPGRER